MIHVHVDHRKGIINRWFFCLRFGGYENISPSQFIPFMKVSQDRFNHCLAEPNSQKQLDNFINHTLPSQSEKYSGLFRPTAAT